MKITAAKGRPMLTWVGKRPLRHVTAFPAQLVERFSVDGGDAEGGGRLYHGDNKEVLAHLLANGYRGKVDLVYIDPPFDSGADYVRKVTLRGPSGSTKIDGETYTLGEQVQYTDIWANDNYLQFMYERLLLLRELLSPSGSLYIHCDVRRSHLLRVVADEVFGEETFCSEVIWQSSDAQSSANRYGPIHNTLLYYGRNGRTWNSIKTPLPKATADTWYTHEETLTADITNSLGIRLAAGTVRRFNAGDLTARKRGGDTQYEWRGVRPPAGRYWAYSKENLEEFEKAGRLFYSGSGRPYLKRYLDEVEGTPPQDVWTDVSMLRGISGVQLTGYPTEKPPALLERVMKISSNPGELVLDCFIGSGTTAAVAQRLGRRWIGCDINKGAIQTTSKRLQTIMREQAAEKGRAASEGEQPSFLDTEKTPDPTPPAHLGFTTWRVNDYDLQIQHNEAVALACEHIGVQRTRTDSFFDGTLGKALVKITPFDHPLSPLDVQEVQRELQSRPTEDRPVTLVCLGIETAARAAVDEWNRLRKGARAANRFDVIELRTDPKYGRFLRHVPASAKVTVKRSKGRVVVEIDDFLSPSIVERLRDQAGVLQPRIDDWRAMVDSVAIDPSYDGHVFDVTLADVPERKTDLVVGRYELDVPAGDTVVAVRITDMLGEEVLVTKHV